MINIFLLFHPPAPANYQNYFFDDLALSIHWLNAVSVDMIAIGVSITHTKYAGLKQNSATDIVPAYISTDSDKHSAVTNSEIR